MFEIVNNHENDVKTINEIITNGTSETLIFHYETDSYKGYYTVSFDLTNERYIIHWYTSQKGISCFYNEYKYYKFTYEAVKQFLNAVITSNINEWCKYVAE